jgi:hypothetical protein
MSEKEIVKATRERAITEAYLKCQNIPYTEILSLRPPDPDVLVRTKASTEMRFELVELADPNEMSAMGSWQNIKQKLLEIHVELLDRSSADQFNEIFSNARFEVENIKSIGSIQKAYKEFLTRFKSEPESYRNFAGDANSASRKLTLRDVISITRIDGLSKPDQMPISMGYWVNRKFEAVTAKFDKSYAADNDVIILAYWKPRFLPGNRREVRERLEGVVRSAASKIITRIVAFDVVKNEVFFDHRTQDPTGQ